MDGVVVGAGAGIVSSVPLAVAAGCATIASMSTPALARLAAGLRLDPSEPEISPRHVSQLRRRLPALHLTIAVLIASQLAPSLVVFAVMAIGSAMLVVLSIVDLAEHRIPNLITYPTIVACLGFSAAAASMERALDDVRSALVGAALFVVVLLVLHLWRPAAMGLGDVKLAFPLGFAIGWFTGDAAMAPAAVGFALVGASVIGLAMAALPVGENARPDGDVSFRGRAVPFGPPLSAAASLTIALALALR